MHREQEVLEAEAQVGRMARLPCKDYLKGTCTTPFCEKWHPPECLFQESEKGCRFREKCSYAHRQTAQQEVEKEWWQKSSVFFKNTQQLGCLFHDVEEPPKPSSILRKSSNILYETNPICSIHESRCTSRWHSRPKSFARDDLPRWSSSAQPQCPKMWGSVSRRDGMARAMCPWSSVEAGQKYLEIKGETQNNILLTFGEQVSICAINHFSQRKEDLL